MKIPDKIYDVLKWLALVAINAVGHLYAACAVIWGWPYGEEVLKTAASVSLCIGILIGITSIDYYKNNGIQG